MSWLPSARRSFLSQFGTGVSVAIGAATLAAGGATLGAQSPGSARRQPRRHAQDNWLDELPGQHRLLLDTTSATGFGNALLYANNFLNSSQADYGLKDADSTVVIVARHLATVFGYNDAIWAKFRAMLSQRVNFTNPQTQKPATINVYNSTSHSAALASLGITLDAVIKRGSSFRGVSDGNSTLRGRVGAVHRRERGRHLQGSHRQPDAQLPYGPIGNRFTESSAGTRVHICVGGITEMRIYREVA